MNPRSIFIRLTAINEASVAMAVVRATSVLYAVGQERPPHRTRVVFVEGGFIDVAEAPGEVSSLVDFAMGEGGARG